MLRCAGALIVDDRGRIFIQRRSPQRRLYPNTWDVVGGHLEPGESYLDALFREVPEETGWTVTEILGLVGEYSYRGDDGQDRVERDYVVRVAGDLAAPRLEEGRHTESRWITPAELDVIDEHRPASGDWQLRQVVADGFATYLAVAPLAPEVRFAALVSPEIDRVFIAGMSVGREGGGRELVRRYGTAAGGLIEFRTALAWPGRWVSAGQFAHVTRYRDRAETQRALAEMVAAGWLERAADGGFRATERAHAFYAELWPVQDRALAAVWPADRVERLLPVAGRVLDAARSSGGLALAAMAPPFEPPGAGPAVLLLNRLGTLRYYTFDAGDHAAAPYHSINVSDRLHLLADLAALPG